MLHGPTVARKTVEAHDDQRAWNEIAGRRQFLAAAHPFVGHSCQVDRGTLASMNLFDRQIVMVKGTHSNHFIRRVPCQFVADLYSTSGSATSDGTVSCVAQFSGS